MPNHIKHVIILMIVVLSLPIAVAEPKAFILKKQNKLIYVFGTLHQTKPHFFPLPQAVTKQLSDANALAVEIDTEIADVQQAINGFMMNYGTLPTGQGLTHMIGNERLQKLSALFEDNEQIAGIQNLRPWLISLMIPQLLAEELGYTDASVDDHLIQLAKKSKKPVIALETPEEQLTVFSTLTKKEELALFEQTLKEAENIEKHLQMIDAIWLDNDAVAAREMLATLQKSSPKVYQALIVTRNHNMIERILKLNQTYPKLFVAVGAAHLYEAVGLVNLLQQEGYQQVNP